MLGTRAQILMLEQQVFDPLSHLLKPSTLVHLFSYIKMCYLIRHIAYCERQFLLLPPACLDCEAFMSSPAANCPPPRQLCNTSAPLKNACPSQSSLLPLLFLFCLFWLAGWLPLSCPHSEMAFYSFPLQAHWRYPFSALLSFQGRVSEIMGGTVVVAE